MLALLKKASLTLFLAALLGPALLQDLGVTLEQLRTLLPAGRVAMTEKEAAFLQSAQRLDREDKQKAPENRLAFRGL